MDLAIIREFLGWCTILNMGVLILSAFMVVGFRKKITGIHNKMFNLDENELSKVYINTLAHYEIAIVVFNIIPYFALKIMG